MSKLKVLGIFGVGFLCGAIIVGGLITWRYSIMFRDQYYARILEMSNTAHMIRAGREDEFLKNAEGSIEQCVVAADSLWGKNESRLGAFWSVQRYYQRHGIDVPAELQPILNNLPPRPLSSCEKKKLPEKSKGGEAERTAPPESEDTAADK